MICLKIQKEMFKLLVEGKDVNIHVSEKEGGHWRISLEPLEPSEMVQILFNTIRERGISIPLSGD